MITSKLSLRQKQQEFVAELETVAGSLAIWAKEKFEEDDWSIADVKFALKNAARICDGMLTKF